MFSTFIFGKCACGCYEDIPVYDFANKKFRTYKLGHHHKDPTKKNWKGGKRIHNKGYIEIYTGKSKRKYEFEHRLVYEEYHKCCLLPYTDIHHINGIKIDNRIENLQPMYDNDHLSFHKKFNEIPNDRICFNCGNNKTYTNTNGYPNWRIYEGNYICIKCYYRVKKYGYTEA